LSVFVIPNFVFLRGRCGRDRSWIYYYLCNQCLSPLKLRARTLLMARWTGYNIMWSSLPVVFFGLSDFLHQWNWPPCYIWIIFESDVKHQCPNPNMQKLSEVVVSDPLQCRIVRLHPYYPVLLEPIKIYIHWPLSVLSFLL
jgi:hypothetical protein